MMKVRALLVLFLVTLLSITSLTRQQPAIAAAPVAYIALGDSIAFGIGSSLPEKRGYPPQVREMLAGITGDSVELHNLAVPGETAESFLANGQVEALADVRRQLDEQRIPVRLVTVSLGGNEMLAERYSGTLERQQALTAFADSLDAAMTRIRDEVGPSPDIVLTTYYDLSEGDPAVESTDAWWTDQFNQVIVDTAARHNALIAEVNSAFRGQIEAWTLHPYDVHPRNQGYRAIARQIWSALALDTEPPGIAVVSSTEANRRTPTLQFDVSDASEIVEVWVSVDGGEPVEPLAVGDGRYVLLLDLRDHEGDEASIRIEAVDSAGNSSRTETQVVFGGR